MNISPVFVCVCVGGGAHIFVSHDSFAHTTHQYVTHDSSIRVTHVSQKQTRLFPATCTHVRYDYRRARHDSQRVQQMHQYVQPIPLGVTFSKAQSSKLERLLCHISAERDVQALSFELWSSIRKCHPKWDWLSDTCLAQADAIFVSNMLTCETWL